MKTIQIVAYEASDGTRFNTERECLDYERSNPHKRLAGLTEEDVLKALKREPSHMDVAQAIEDAGIAIRNARRKAGDFRREPPERKPKTAAAASVSENETATEQQQTLV